MTRYIIRNGGFQKKEAMKNKPEPIREGYKLLCKTGTGTISVNRYYEVRGHFCYLNTYGPTGSKEVIWDEFVTIKNDFGYTIKVNLNNFHKPYLLTSA